MTFEDSPDTDGQTQFPEKFDGVIPPAPSRSALPDVQHGVNALPRTPVVQDEASRSSRLAARMIDGIIVIIPWLIASFSSDNIFSALFGFITIAIIVYQFILLSREGQTIGKRTMNIRIVKANTGETGGFVTNVLLREIVNAILGFIPFYSLADILFIFREDNKCIHDHIAKTKVICD